MSVHNMIPIKRRTQTPSILEVEFPSSFVLFDNGAVEFGQFKDFKGERHCQEFNGQREDSATIRGHDKSAQFTALCERNIGKAYVPRELPFDQNHKVEDLPGFVS
jgi:hypothetical protein